jgi:hypothetical protein
MRKIAAEPHTAGKPSQAEDRGNRSAQFGQFDPYHAQALPSACPSADGPG